MNDTISTAISEILDNPVISVSHDGDTEFYYSSSQLLYAYSVGQKELQGRIKKEKDAHVTPYTEIRSMDVGDWLRFAYSKYNAVRSAAAKIKKQFGAEYKTKVVLDMGVKWVQITRLR